MHVYMCSMFCLCVSQNICSVTRSPGFKFRPQSTKYAHLKVQVMLLRFWIRKALALMQYTPPHCSNWQMLKLFFSHSHFTRYSVVINVFLVKLSTWNKLWMSWKYLWKRCIWFYQHNEQFTSVNWSELDSGKKFRNIILEGRQKLLDSVSSTLIFIKFFE